MAENREKDTVIKLEDQGVIHIAEDVLAAIASLAASETDGVVLMAAAGQVMGKKNLHRGIKLHTTDNTVVIETYIMVKYGVVIPKIAEKLQENVKSAVESMSGLTVSDVHVHVGGICFEKEKK